MFDLRVIFDLEEHDASCIATAAALPYCGTALEELPERWREYYEERAAIREYEGGQAREHAEAEALTETLIAIHRCGHDML